ncbi:alpha/beta fold hydrolase [Planctomicrobium sp. SH661]|uniref:alpha/beta fold hydrolase n=1 Tax=Planctomicrobium sp. SH661 TaxID=3448124 RepID=UPI003F5BB57B
MSVPVLPADVLQEYPFTPKSMQIDGLRYSYVDEGTGPVLLFVHGNPTWSFAWRNLIKALSSQYRCIAVDHIGMGLSDKPQNYSYHIAQHIQNLQRLIEHLDLKDITLLGHDWGGCIGMGAAGRTPQRFRRFVMMNTAAFRSQRIPLRIAVCRTPVLGPLGVRGFNLFAAAAITMAVTKPMSPAVKKGFLLPYDSWANRISVQRFVEEIPLEPAHPSYQTLVDVEQGLAQFKDHPFLFIWGEQDWCFTTAFLDEWEERFPQARTVRYPDAGHYVFEDAHERMVPELRAFLGE